MPLPLIAAGIAARAVASRLATRAVGGIVGAGAKTVAPVYRNTGSVKVVPAVTEFKKDAFNSARTSIANQMKSGKLAKDVAKSKTPPRENLMFPPKTIKINSGNTRAK